MPTGVYDRTHIVVSKETRRKLSENLKKRWSEGSITPWNKGLKDDPRTKYNRPTSFKKGEERISGENNHLWKGGLYRDKNYVTWSKHSRNRKIKELNTSGSYHSKKEWEMLKTKYNWTCPCCKKSEPEIKLQKDHIVPVSRGGSDDIGNIQPLCPECNGKKWTKSIKY